MRHARTHGVRAARARFESSPMAAAKAQTAAQAVLLPRLGGSGLAGLANGSGAPEPWFETDDRGTTGGDSCSSNAQSSKSQFEAEPEAGPAFGNEGMGEGEGGLWLGRYGR